MKRSNVLVPGAARCMPRLPGDRESDRMAARRVLGALLLAVVLALACRGSGSESVRLELGDRVLEVALEPETPRVGPNAMRLAYRARAGGPVEQAHVEVRVHMPAMGAMAAMGGPAAVRALEDGDLRADFDLAMGGTWQVEIELHEPDRPSVRAEGALSVGSAGLRLAAIGRESTGEAEDGHAGEIVVAPGRLQQIGVTTIEAALRPLAPTLRAPGRVVLSDSGQVDVVVRVDGFVVRVLAEAVGVQVRAGDVLLELESPQLLAAQEEFLEALRSRTRAHGTSAPDRADALARAARQRLSILGLADADIAALERTGIASRTTPVRAPRSGIVVEKEFVAGSAVPAGARPFRIADLRTVWVEADLPESELAAVEIGARAQLRATHAPGVDFEGRVVALLPGLDVDTRTRRVRLEVANRDLRLRPDVFTEVEFERPAQLALLVPQSAVVVAGERSFVFLALGDGRFRPQAVRVGRRVEEEVEILDGLSPGQCIVRSGTFLIAAESRLRAALEQW